MVKMVIAVLLALVLVVFIAQNTMVVNVNFIAWTMPISLAFLMLLSIFFGSLLGMVLTEVSLFRKNAIKRRKERKEAEETKERAKRERQKQDDKMEKQEAARSRRNKKNG